MIHNILILRESGENIFNKNFSKTNWDETLASGFISATFNFTQNTFGAEIQDIELGPYRLLFERGDNIIIVALFDKYDSIINIREILIKINDTIKNKFGAKIKDFHNHYLEEFNELDEITEKIISELSHDHISKKIKDNYKVILDNFRSNNEILDCDLISVSGVPLIKEWKKDFLDLCLRQMDAFWKSKRYSLDRIILSYEERHVILQKINDNLVLTALIRRNTPIGLAELLIEETANKIFKI